MITLRKGTFETNSSSCHTLSIYNIDDWNKLVNNSAFVLEPYSFKDSKIISMETTRNLIKDCMEDFRIKNNLDFEPYNNFYEKLQDDVFLKKVIQNNYHMENVTDDPLLKNSLDNLGLIYSYDEAFGDNSEIWCDEDEDSFIYIKGDTVVISGQISC